MTLFDSWNKSETTFYVVFTSATENHENPMWNILFVQFMNRIWPYFFNKTLRITLKLIRKYILCMQHICCQESPGERIWSLEKLTTFVFWPVSCSFSYPNLTVLLTWGRALLNNRKNPGLTAPAWGLTVGLRFSWQSGCCLSITLSMASPDPFYVCHICSHWTCFHL